MKKYECIKELQVDCYDDEGFYEEKQCIAEVGSIWTDEEVTFRLLDGEVILENDDLEWLEINKDILEEYFKLIS